MGRVIRNLKKNNENVFSTDSVGSFLCFSFSLSYYHIGCLFY